MAKWFEDEDDLEEVGSRSKLHLLMKKLGPFQLMPQVVMLLLAEVYLSGLGKVSKGVGRYHSNQENQSYQEVELVLQRVIACSLPVRILEH